MGMAAGAVAPQIVGRLMMSPAGQAYLRNQLLSGAIQGQTRAQIVAALNVPWMLRLFHVYSVKKALKVRGICLARRANRL